MSSRQDLSKLFLTQKSLTEWLQDIAHTDTENLRHEDNEKRERLRVLNRLIDLPFDKPTQFQATDIIKKSLEHETYIKEHGDDLCALRLIPLDKSLPKLRMRGMTIHEVQSWFYDQKIDPEKYRAEYIPHSDNQKWATIFVINEQGISGEIIRGHHSQLTQGFYDDDHVPYTFSYDYNTWSMYPENKEALDEVKNIISRLEIPNNKQVEIKAELDAHFMKNYLQGYFETTHSEDFGLWFIDYSPTLGKRISGIVVPHDTKHSEEISGQIACAGIVVGTVVIIDIATPPPLDSLQDDAVLVCAMTTPELVPYMMKSVAIVTDQGGILSHAAIVARELGKPCIVGTSNATSVLKDGMKVRVDADNGIVLLV